MGSFREAWIPFSILNFQLAVISCPRALELPETFRHEVKHLWFLHTSCSHARDNETAMKADFVADCEIRIINFVYVFYFFFIIPCSGQGDTFMDPALLDNLREHHVST